MKHPRRRCLHVLALLALAAPLGADGEAERVDALFAPWDTRDAPGMSVAVVRAGELLYARGFGLASLEHGVANGPDTVFRIGSTSKQFTAACIALLALRGELDLDGDVRTHFPALRAHERPITVRHLLHHTSGIRDYIELAELAGEHEQAYVTPEESIAAIERQRGLCFPPGTRFQYSNSNYLLLGEIVHRVSGESLAEFARANLFEPLGMAHTHFQDRHDRVVRNRAFGYSPAGKGRYRLDITTLDHVGDGGVFTTVRDLARWDGNFYACALPAGQAFLDLVATRGVLDDGTRLDYAFGLVHGEQRGLRTVRHGGAWVGYRAELLRFPDERLSVVCLANRSDVDPSELAERVADVYLGDRYKAQAPSEAAAEVPRARREERAARVADADVVALGEWLGSYWSPDLATTFELVLDRGHLAVQRGRRAPVRMRLHEDGRGRCLGFAFELERDAVGAVSGLLARATQAGDFHLRRVPPREEPAPALARGVAAAGDERLRVGFVIVEGVYNSELMAPWDVFHHTVFHTQPGMRVFSVAPTRASVRTFEDVRLLPDYAFDDAPPIDVLVVPSAAHSMDSDLADEALVRFVRERGRAARHVVSLCDGAFVLAAAGLLKGRRSTTFPSDVARLREMFPTLAVAEGVSFVHDGQALTSAGGAKSYDAALYLVELLYGADVARGVARGLVIDWDRAALAHLVVPQGGE